VLLVFGVSHISTAAYAVFKFFVFVLVKEVGYLADTHIPIDPPEH
jgi:hypothetical protein